MLLTIKYMKEIVILQTKSDLLLSFLVQNL